ncbi:hypothetical protein OF829_15585 [Sphingomonas sp. LB-2]|uniref:hypothetical protein n=1 Tax=Sphingomonas caeni TaxID=2984949 RepID=UPI00222EB85A|nr:hypothetical protein [Sphingomonas caeni]MCW3848657.1 hypothetical protein [Sphingomonas caeni]
MWGRIGMSAVVMLAVPAAAQAQTAPQRAELLDALRIVIAKDLGQPVKFVVDDLRVRTDWAFIVAHPQTPAGAPIDFSKTRYAEQQEEGVLDGDTIYALLQRRAGKWVVVAFMIGPTDVGWLDWRETYHVPAGVIPQPGGN